MVSEIEGSWIDTIDGQGNLSFAVKAPGSYPSDRNRFRGAGSCLPTTRRPATC